MLQVVNIEDLSIKDAETSVSFKETHDHSKWAVTTDLDTGKEQTWICIGDINRAVSSSRLKLHCHRVLTHFGFQNGFLSILDNDRLLLLLFINLEF